VTIHVTDGAVRRAEPDGHGRLVAYIVAAVAAEERRRLIERTQSGQRRAREEGKWLGEVPTGFVRSDEGYLKPNLDSDYDEGETGFFDAVDALERFDDGGSYRSTAKDTPNVTRQTLSTIHQDQERRRWYLVGKGRRRTRRRGADGGCSRVSSDGSDRMVELIAENPAPAAEDLVKVATDDGLNTGDARQWLEVAEAKSDVLEFNGK
jgi:hypothetical protein